MCLSPRECQCLEYLSIGLRPAAIAKSLGLSVKTVDKHIASARMRLGASTREHAVSLAIAKGLIPCKE